MAAGVAHALPIDPSAPTGSWTAVQYPSLLPDYSDDQQTGLVEGDIVGNATDPALYTAFDDAGTASLTDGTLAFRVRLGADGTPAGFDFFFGVGIDADLNGSIDLFLAVNNTGVDGVIGIYDAGSGLNTSPNTTSIVATPITSYTEMTSNYDWSAVDATIDPTASSFDVDGDGNTDYFLSYSVQMQDIVDALLAQGIAFDEDTMFQLVAGTSTQVNALNRDLGGPEGGINSTTSWGDLGAFSTPTSAGNLFPVPEPGAGMLLGLGLVCLGALRPRRR